MLEDWVSAAVIADGSAVAGVRNTEELRRMLRLYAAATASVTPKDRPTADRLEVDRSTVARYRSLLADLHVTWDLPALVPGNATGQVTKSPKVHLVDSGLAAHLAGRDSPAALDRDPAFTGALVETMVVNDLRVLEQRPHRGARGGDDKGLLGLGADGRRGHVPLAGVEVGRLTLDIYAHGPSPYPDSRTFRALSTIRFAHSTILSASPLPMRCRP
jgi:hypothetical protein